MKRVNFVTPVASVKFNGKAPAALAILQILDSHPNEGLNVPQIEALLVEGAGVMMKGSCDKQHVSLLLQRLIKLGAVQHPPGRGNSRKYQILHWPRIVRC